MSLDMREYYMDKADPRIREQFLKQELDNKERELAWSKDYSARLEQRIVELHAKLAELTEEYTQLLKSK